MRSVGLRERDVGFLKFCCEQKFVFKEQADEWFGSEGKIVNRKSADRVVRRRLARFKEQGWLTDETHGVASGKVWAITKQGLSLLKDQGQVPEYLAQPRCDVATLNHDRCVTQIRLSSLRRYMKWQWVPEILIRDGSSEKIPDAIVNFNSPKKGLCRIAIEVELSQKSEARLKSIFEDYQTSDFALVLYFVSTTELQSILTRIAHESCQKVYFCLVSEFCDVQQNIVWKNLRDEFSNTHFQGDH